MDGVGEGIMSKSRNGKEEVATLSNVTAIRKGVRVRKRNRPEDGAVVALRGRMLNSLAAVETSIGVGATRDGTMSQVELALAEALLPTRNLRCIHSTLDERKDFQLRCAEAQLRKAEHALFAAKKELQRLVAGDAWWGSETYSYALSEIHKLWNKYRDSIQIVAATPARTEPQLKQKRELIGRLWLSAEGEWYDKLRAGVAADVEWLRENDKPERRRRRHLRLDL